MNAPRDEIEEAEYEIDELEPENEQQPEESTKMALPVADALDLSMIILFDFIKEKFTRNVDKNQILVNKLFEVFLSVFEQIILSTHNPLHVQFVIYYFCSLRVG